MNEVNFTKAHFKIEGTSTLIPVHFNPESLNYTIANTLKNTGRDANKKQYISKSTGKLSMDLIFDTTDTGEDVRLHTVKVAKFMEPRSEKAPAIVLFEWGLYKFKGMVETYKEAIDFFSADGVPLRAKVSLTLSSQDKVFEGGSATRKSKTGGSLDGETGSIPAFAPPGKGTADIASKAGNPGAARAIAEFNGVENLRFPGDIALEINASITLGEPATFASGSLSGGLSLGVDLDLGVGSGLGAGLDVGGGLANVGADLSAGVTASAGAFSGLHTASSSGITAKLNLDNFIQADVTSSIGLEGVGGIALGGATTFQGSASLKAEVGAPGELSARLEFD